MNSIYLCSFVPKRRFRLEVSVRINAITTRRYCCCFLIPFVKLKTVGIFFSFLFTVSVRRLYFLFENGFAGTSRQVLGNGVRFLFDCSLQIDSAAE